MKWNELTLLSQHNHRQYQLLCVTPIKCRTQRKHPQASLLMLLEPTSYPGISSGQREKNPSKCVSWMRYQTPGSMVLSMIALQSVKSWNWQRFGTTFQLALMAENTSRSLWQRSQCKKQTSEFDLDLVHSEKQIVILTCGLLFMSEHRQEPKWCVCVWAARNTSVIVMHH